jgi:hypothetical protein
LGQRYGGTLLNDMRANLRDVSWCAIRKTHCTSLLPL